MIDVRKDFPILGVGENGARLVYLDNGATTQKPAKVLDAVRDYYLRDNANPHRGVYDLAQRATDVHENARARAARFIGAEPEELIFTQNASESLNLVASSYGGSVLRPGDEILVYVAEHHSNLVPWQRAAEKTGATLRYLYPDGEGRLTPKELREKIGPRTKVVAVAQVSNVLGLVTPVEEIVELAHRAGAAVVLDCAQSVPHMPVDVKALGVDFAAFSGHKLYSPMGVGGLYGKKELLAGMPPFLTGGDMIAWVHESGAAWAEAPRKFEAGTRNVGGEVGLAAAMDYMESIGWEAITAHEEALMDMALEGLRAMPFVTVYGGGGPKDRKGVISFNVEGVHPHDVATILDAEGVAVRAGHHCAQPLMEFLGIGACARLSFAVYNTAQDVEIFLRALGEVRRWMGL